MSPLNHKRATSSLAPPIFYVAKTLAIKRYTPHCCAGLLGDCPQLPSDDRAGLDVAKRGKGLRLRGGVHLLAPDSLYDCRYLP